MGRLAIAFAGRVACIFNNPTGIAAKWERLYFPLPQAAPSLKKIFVDLSIILPNDREKPGSL
jgi:hypothetical protein